MGMTQDNKIDMEGDVLGDQNIDEPNRMTEKKCAHKINMKGHGDPWCVLFRKVANCELCFGVGAGTNHRKIKVLGDLHVGSDKRERYMKIYGGTSEPARLNYNNMVQKLIGRPGVTLLHDEFIIDPEEWVSPFTEGELVTYNDQLARVIKIVGPVVKIRLQRRDYPKHLDVMDWDIKKRSVKKWVKKQLRKLWHKV